MTKPDLTPDLLDEVSPPRPAPTGELAGPVKQGDRIVSIDVLRGFALLGILVMNISTFALPMAAYWNPTVMDDRGIDYAVWYGTHLFFDTKMMTIFTMLFGAGIVLMADRARARTGRSAGLHYRRMFWLLLFGLVHHIGFWFGDILMTYAMCGMIAYLFVRLAPVWLLITGACLILVSSLMNILWGGTFEYWPKESQVDIVKMWSPTPTQLEEEMQRGATKSFGAALLMRTESAIFVPFLVFLIGFGYRIIGAMLLGMALYKMRVFDASRRATTYAGMALLGFGIGLPIIAAGVIVADRMNWWTETVGFFFATQFNYWGGIAVALGWVGVVMLACREGVGRLLQRSLAAVGQMALTNYLMHTLICTTVFYSYMFGQFGTMSRAELMLVVLAVWIFQLVVSPIWLSAFRYGPVEYLWRALTYWSLPTFRRAPNAASER